MKNECNSRSSQVRVPKISPISRALIAMTIALLFHSTVVRGQVGCVPYTANYPCVYVANQDNTVSVINAANQVIDTIQIPAGTADTQPGGLAVTPDNAFVYLAKTLNSTGVGGSVSVITTDNDAVANPVPLKGPDLGGIAITPDGKEVWVAESAGNYASSNFVGVEILNTTTDPAKNPPAVIAQLTGLVNPTAIAFTPDGTTAYIADTCNVSSPTTGQPQVACIDKVSVATHTLIKPQIQIPNTFSYQNQGGSIVVTPDGSLACMSTLGGNRELMVSCINTSDGSILNPMPPQTVGGTSPSDYGFGITPADILYAALPLHSGDASQSQIFLFDPIGNSFIGTTPVGAGPTGVAISADGASVYVTSCCNQSSATPPVPNAGEVSIIDLHTGAITTVNVGTNSQGVAAMPSIPPTITTQPAGEIIDYGQTTTLSVSAAGTPPLSYQWYAQNGSTSSPIQGATSSSYTTPALTSTTIYYVTVSNSVLQANPPPLKSSAATITVNPYSPPAIATQPVSQAIVNGQAATLTVAATGTPPLAYQWYQGLTGDTSMPIAGATGSSYTTPALTTTTNYWVLVSTLVQGQSGSVASNTVTITVNHAPTCSNLALQGIGSANANFQTLYKIKAIVSCTDPQNSPLTTSIDWGDGSSSPASLQPDGTFTATHTYVPPPASYYAIAVSATDSFNLQGTISNETILIPATSVNAVFPGQSINVPISLPWPYSPVQVTFTCTTVIDSSGQPHDASVLGISCNSTPSPVTLSPPGPSVTLNIQTTGSAVATTSLDRKIWFYAVCLPLPAMLFCGIGLGRRVSRRRILKIYGTQILIVGLFLQLVGCGGGFVLPSASAPAGTPPGSYQITIVDSPVNSNTSGFVQISLIVPLTVSQPK